MNAKDRAAEKRSLISRFLNTIERIGNALPHPVTLFAIFAVALLGLSWVANRIGLRANNPKDGSPVETVNLLSTDGLHWLLENTIENFAGFAVSDPDHEPVRGIVHLEFQILQSRPYLLHQFANFLFRRCVVL